MLLEQIIRVGRPISSSKMPIQEKIQLLTDVGSEQVKNFYKHIFLVQLDKTPALHFFSLQTDSGDVNLKKASALPITLPSGGNPLLAQGIYPIPCYPMYEKHIDQFHDIEKTSKMIYDRLIKTIPYFGEKKEPLKNKANLVAKILQEQGVKYITDEKQLGILVIADRNLSIYHPASPNKLQVTDEIEIDGHQVVDLIVEGRFQEAKELGEEKDTRSSFSGKQSDEVVSAYNKGWLFLSPTWEMPKSIYWGKKDWTKGIRLNREEYESFFYGTQFLKKVQTPLQSSLLKEMFAPVLSVEAKRNMRPGSFEPIFAIPIVLPVLNENNDQVFKRFRVLSRKISDQVSKTDLQLEIIGGIEKKVVPQSEDDYRLSILYYSGELGRGNIHIRALIEDVVPSVAYKVQQIIQRLLHIEFPNIMSCFHSFDSKPIQFKLKYLPSLLSNAYGPGYLWSSLHSVLHQKPIYLERVTKKAAQRLNELAKKRQYRELAYEIIFYHSFRYFYQEYHKEIFNKEGGQNMSDWKQLLERFRMGQLTEGDVNTPETLGFITGCLLQQFSRSYAAKTGKSFLEARVMRFGSQLTPEMIWKNGLLKMEQLKQQWDLGIQRKIYEPALSLVLLKFVELDQKQVLKKEKDLFMTMFWSGYLMYSQIKKGESEHVDS